MENGYHNGGARNGHANGSIKVENVNGANGNGAIEIGRPVLIANPRPAAAAREQRAQLRGIGVVGLGYWGPNWVRNLHQSQAARRIVACDLDQKRRTHVSQLYSDLETTSRFEDLLNDDEIEGIVIATPVSTHYPMAQPALEAGKSVLVEKPLATSSEEAEDLVHDRARTKTVLMVGHTFEYSAPVLKMPELIASGELGDIFYISSVRANLGLFQHDVNVTVGSRDPRHLDHPHADGRPDAGSGELPGRQPLRRQRRGCRDADVALSERNVIAFIHVSWLDPDKIRRTTIVGSRKMLVYDDTEPQEKIRIYDKGVSAQRYYDTFGDFQFSYRYGDIHIPRIEETEPLRCECEHFVDCIRTSATPEHRRPKRHPRRQRSRSCERFTAKRRPMVPVSGVQCDERSACSATSYRQPYVSLTMSRSARACSSHHS